MRCRDINPQAPVHFLVIPKRRDGLTRLQSIEERHEQLLGHLLVVASRVARQENLKEGYRVTINDGPNGCARHSCACSVSHRPAIWSGSRSAGNWMMSTCGAPLASSF